MIKKILDWWIDNIPQNEIEDTAIEMDSATYEQFNAEYIAHVTKIWYPTKKEPLIKYRGIRLKVQETKNKFITVKNMIP